MRENRTYGSEGGETGQPVFPTPISPRSLRDRKQRNLPRRRPLKQRDVTRPGPAGVRHGSGIGHGRQNFHRRFSATTDINRYSY